MRRTIPLAAVRRFAPALGAMPVVALSVARASAATISLISLAPQTVTTLLIHQDSDEPIR